MLGCLLKAKTSIISLYAVPTLAEGLIQSG